MSATFHLILHNVVAIASAVAALGTSYFTFFNSRKAANIFFALTILGSAVFIISHVVGVNISDPFISRTALMFNIVVFLIAAFNLHAVYAYLGIDHEKRRTLAFVYTAAIFLTLFFMVFPELYLNPSVPKMYFPNYYEPAVLNWTRLAFLHGIVVPYILYEIFAAYRRTQIPNEKKKYIYFLVSILVGYAIAVIPNFLVFNIEVDPLWGMPFVLLFSIPFVYGAVRYEMLDIQVIAKQAFWYSVAVGLIGGFITMFNFAGNILSDMFPAFPTWSMSLVSAILVVSASILVWHKLRESDLLKYEFITTVTHKFRTPLTHIKWAAENLRQSSLSETDKTQLEYIEHSNTKLVELTNLLMNVSGIENDDFEYHFSKNDLNNILDESLKATAAEIENRGAIVEKQTLSPAFINCDPGRIRFVVQTLIENALNYSPKKPELHIKIERRLGKKGNSIVFSVSDKGIGIPHEEISLLFAKFYRSKRARLADTEGMGIGLYIAREIINRHRGKIWIESEGLDKGSTFTFAIPEDK